MKRNKDKQWSGKILFRKLNVVQHEHQLKSWANICAQESVPDQQVAVVLLLLKSRWYV